MPSSRIQNADDLLVRVDIGLRTVLPADQTSGRDLGLCFDAAQILSKPAYGGQTSGLCRSRAMIGAQRKFKRERRGNLARPLCLHKRNEVSQTRFDPPKFET